MQLVGVDTGRELGDQVEQRATRPRTQLDLGVDPSGSTRGRFSGRPPPVMWASALTFPEAERTVEHVQVRTVRLEQGVAERDLEPGRIRNRCS